MYTSAYIALRRKLDLSTRVPVELNIGRALGQIKKVLDYCLLH